MSIKKAKDIYWHNNLLHALETKHVYKITIHDSGLQESAGSVLPTIQPDKGLINRIIDYLSDTYPSGCLMKIETTVEATDTIESDELAENKELI